MNFDPDNLQLLNFVTKSKSSSFAEITRDSAGSELEMYSDEDYDSGRGRMGRRHPGK